MTPENVREVETRLQQHKIPYKTLIFEDEKHGIIKPSNLAKRYPGLAKFFDDVIS